MRALRLLPETERVLRGGGGKSFQSLTPLALLQRLWVLEGEAGLSRLPGKASLLLFISLLLISLLMDPGAGAGEGGTAPSEEPAEPSA